MTKVSLAVADSAFAFNILVNMSAVLIKWQSTVPNVLGILGTFVSCVSFCHVSLMALQRFYAIKWPLKYSQITKRKQVIYIIVTWLVNIPILVGLLHQNMDNNSPDYIDTIFIIIGQVIPFIATIICTIAMLVAYFQYISSSGVHNSTIASSRIKWGFH